MFTGIVEHFGTLETVERLPSGALRLSIQSRFLNLIPGESISVDGCCLTALPEGNTGLFACDVSLETVDRTIVGSYLPGHAVNLERSLAVGDRLGGHWVTGHIDSQGVLEAKETLDGFEKWTVRLTDPATARYLVPKGSIAVNGVSLTVNEVAGGNFSLMLIPHTVSTTSFHQAVVGDRFNLEFDCLVKTVIQEMSRWRSGVEGGTTFGNK